MAYQPKRIIKLVMAGIVLGSSLGSLAQVPMATTAAENGPAATAAKPSDKPMNGVAQGVPKTPTRPPKQEMLPPQAPQVTYQDGMLSINAANSTFGEVFRAVQETTGMMIEYPTTAANERIAVELGPDKPKDVIKNLLAGSNFNYILTGVPGDSGRVQRLVLTVQGTQPAGTVSIASSASPKTPVQVGVAKPKATTVARRTTSDGRPAEPAILSGPSRTRQPVTANTALQNAQNDAQNALNVQRTEFWMQIAREHAQRMADPKNQNAPPPPPPPMEVPPPTQPPPTE
jgi:hypothetical protein